jgi:hypothetical protein
MITTIRERALKIVSADVYKNINLPTKLEHFDIVCPTEETRILRMLIREPFVGFKIPEEFEYMRKFIEYTDKCQTKMGIRQPFCYLTIRCGLANGKTDSEWHVDGFSTQITHIPEQNYIWIDNDPTEYIEGSFNVPRDFNPLKNNVNWLLSDQINENTVIKKLEAKRVYCFDPYILHRRPESSTNKWRTFVRVSYTPIEIRDDNNKINPLLPQKVFNKKGIDFRNTLTRYVL